MFRYIGNKTKLLDPIVKKVHSIIGESGTVVDLMCGTGNVSIALKNFGYNVISVDVMTYAYFHAMVGLTITEEPDFDEILKLEDISPHDNLSNYMLVLDYLNNLDLVEDYFYREFSPGGTPENGCSPRKYFISKNACKIDAIREKINTWKFEGVLNLKAEALLKHDLILSANKIANISGTYGHFHSKVMKKALDDFILYPHLNTTDTIDSNNHTVIQGHAEEIASSLSADLIYIDPPYTKRQYAANYHVLETLARGDFPEAVGISGLRPWRDQYSNFCSKVKIRDSLNTIIKDADSKYFLMSYSEDGLLSKEELVEFLMQYGAVDVDYIKHKRFKSNNSSLSKDLFEYLILLTKSSDVKS